MQMLDIVAGLTNSAASSSRGAVIMSVTVMQQSIGALKQLSTVLRDYDPVMFISTLDMSKIVDTMQLSVADLPEEVRFDRTLNSYTQVLPSHTFTLNSVYSLYAWLKF